MHEEARDCNEELIEQRLAERNELPNHLIFFGGDVLNLIMPKDFKRYMVSTAATHLATRDDYLNAALDYAENRWKPHKKRIMAVGKGNHEQKVVEYHSYDIVREFCRRMGVPAAGYCGMLRLHFEHKSSGRRALFCVAWHHGAWGGVVIQGLAGAERFFSKIEGWDVALYGHNHATNTRMYDSLYFDGRGKVKHRPRALVNCGTYLKTMVNDDMPDYAEQKGYPPVHLGSPMIRLKVHSKPLADTGKQIHFQVVNE